MDQVERVRPTPHADDHRVAQPAERVGAGGHPGDQQCSGSGDHGQPAVEEPVRRGRAEDPDGDQADQEHRGRPAEPSPNLRCSQRAPMGERSGDHAKEQLECPGVGTEVGTLATGGQSDRQRDQRRRCCHPEHDRHQVGAAPHRHPQRHSQQDRQRQVELLLHRERPEVLHWAGNVCGSVVPPRPADEPPVHDVQGSGDRVAADVIASPEERMDRVDEGHSGQGDQRHRRQASHPLGCKRAPAPRAGAVAVEDLSGDQKPGDREEQRHAEVAGSGTQLGVVGDHRQDGQSAQPVE